MNKLLLSFLLSISFVSNVFCGGNEWAIANHLAKTALYGTAALGTVALAYVTYPGLGAAALSVANSSAMTLTINEAHKLAEAIIKK